MHTLEDIIALLKETQAANQIHSVGLWDVLHNDYSITRLTNVSPVETAMVMGVFKTPISRPKELKLLPEANAFRGFSLPNVFSRLRPSIPKPQTQTKWQLTPDTPTITRGGPSGSIERSPTRISRISNLPVQRVLPGTKTSLVLELEIDKEDEENILGLTHEELVEGIFTWEGDVPQPDAGQEPIPTDVHRLLLSEYSLILVRGDDGVLRIQIYQSPVSQAQPVNMDFATRAQGLFDQLMTEPWFSGLSEPRKWAYMTHLLILPRGQGALWTPHGKLEVELRRPDSTHPDERTFEFGGETYNVLAGEQQWIHWIQAQYKSARIDSQPFEMGVTPGTESEVSLHAAIRALLKEQGLLESLTELHQETYINTVMSSITSSFFAQEDACDAAAGPGRLSGLEYSGPHGRVVLKNANANTPPKRMVTIWGNLYYAEEGTPQALKALERVLNEIKQSDLCFFSQPQLQSASGWKMSQLKWAGTKGPVVIHPVLLTTGLAPNRIIIFGGIPFYASNGALEDIAEFNEYLVREGLDQPIHYTPIDERISAEFTRKPFGEADTGFAGTILEPLAQFIYATLEQRKVFKDNWNAARRRAMVAVVLFSMGNCCPT